MKKIVEVVIEENTKRSKGELVACYCPSEFNQNDSPDCKNITCIECWNRRAK